MQRNVENTLFPPAFTNEVLKPDKTAVRQHPYLQLQQTAILAKNGAVRQPRIVKHQLIVDAKVVQHGDADRQRAGKK